MGPWLPQPPPSPRQLQGPGEWEVQVCLAVAQCAWRDRLVGGCEGEWSLLGHSGHLGVRGPPNVGRKQGDSGCVDALCHHRTFRHGLPVGVHLPLRLWRWDSVQRVPCAPAQSARCTLGR